MAELKDRLRELRKENNFTQQEVAKFLDITESAYGFYEQGRNEPSVQRIKMLAKKYNVSVSYLTGETDEKRNYTSPDSDVNSAFYKYKDLDDEEIEFLDEQLEVFRRIRQNKIDRENRENKK
ncbi:helix-turn-helix domain-containing protein [Shouchella lehensis]|uniref:XRE family transcriptional regulator n=1 Tax=Shouchella lehensis TaxID=300825 RepID=A0A4Y7WKM2_9BACI|nr:helix-turn-helix transcriptional regulator [Shouchella lehensis]MBG9783472.1 XRE family transcriptional regulator [Shouchella lehensis]TES49135.1 XRE family transcriptional regulator [Shouchella lehensis]